MLPCLKKAKQTHATEERLSFACNVDFKDKAVCFAL